jgi:hypothetical protein
VRKLGLFVAFIALLCVSAPAHASSSVVEKLRIGDNCTKGLHAKHGTVTATRRGRHLKVHVKATIPANDMYHLEIWRPTRHSCAQVGTDSPTLSADASGDLMTTAHFPVPRRRQTIFVALRDDTVSQYYETPYFQSAP